jgi:bisanhydrobacterioruberin hydratase
MNKSKIILLLLAIFYVVGIIGISFTPWKDLLLSLTPLILGMSFAAIYVSRIERKTEWLYFLLFCGGIGWTVEWIGVHTGLLFGTYSYGANLGPKLDEIPVMIAVNWCLVTVTSASLVGRLKIYKWWRPMIAAFLMVILDVAIEPVAIQSDFWSWETAYIPMYNYVCWFFIGLFLQIVLFLTKLEESNIVNDGLFFIMLVFFLALNILN